MTDADSQKNQSHSMPSWLTSKHLAGMLRGIEKEGLRMQPDGYLAQTPHPKSLGSKLTHPHITTDYSESLLELITSPKPTVTETLKMLSELHVLVYQSLEDGELIWPLSMPCMLSSDDEDIPLADYGRSNVGKLKTLYRNGLGVRYGRRMQTIAGLHYNLSFSDDLFTAWREHCSSTEQYATLTDFKNAKYLGLIRNFKRMGTLVLYLTGASPSVCPCFLVGRDHDLSLLNDATYYKPYATSLRMGKLGYTNSVQDQLDIRYNSLPEYVQGLQDAVNTPFKDFSGLGVDDKAGNPTQINDHILQIENEYYSPIRPKQIAESGETPSHALQTRGIAYVEFRAVDLDPYSNIGIRLSTACFLEVLALYCLLSDSPDLMPDEDTQIADNIERVVNQGRQEDLQIMSADGEISFHTWMQDHLEAMLPYAALLDAQYGGNNYRVAVTLMLGKAAYPKATLSAQVIADTEEMGSTWKLGQLLAQQHRDTLMDKTLSPNQRANYEVLAEKSWIQQRDIENSDNLSFYEYIQQYR